MSTVLIIGASKGIGLETVRLALKAGHSVRALRAQIEALRKGRALGPASERYGFRGRDKMQR